MTTSNSIDFAINAETCIRMALEEINVIGEGDYLENYDFNRGKKTLNMMLKAWQSQDNHLWVKQTAILFLQNSQAIYDVSLSTVDHFTSNSIIQTTLSAAYPLGATTITVTSTAGMTTNDYIGLKMTNNYMFWTTIQSIPIAGTIILTNPLTYSASSGTPIFTYTTNLPLPFQVYAGVRHDIISGIDAPLNIMSYREYFDMPNKATTTAAVTMWGYDRQLENYKIFVWGMPGNVDYYLRFIIARKIQDIDVNSDTFDLPQEWQLAIVKTLAVLLAPSYGKAQGDNFMELKIQAMESKKEAMEMDNELGSIFIKPNADGFRRP